MSFGGFILGVLIMAAGLGMLIKSNQIEQSFGDIGYLLGFNQSWLNWKTVSVFFIIVGFLVAFGLIGEIFTLTIGNIFPTGQ